MNGTRIEIFKDNEWKSLVLSEKSTDAILYNKVINRIGELSSREISHTNTFALPNVAENVSLLNLNKFNYIELANSLNKKYQAKYYIKNILVQEGYLIMNNIGENGEINVNFIDSALELIDKWGEYTYIDFLRSGLLNFNPDYKSQIDAMRNYDMIKTGKLTKIPNISGKTYPIAYFPNNLNIMGDDFCVSEITYTIAGEQDTKKIRVDNRINFYQTRPIFNVKAMFDLVTETFGYTTEYDNSIDWSVLEKTAIVKDGVVDDILVGEEYSDFIEPTSDPDRKTFDENNGYFYSTFEYPEGKGEYPLTTFDPNISSGWFYNNQYLRYMDFRDIYIPNFSETSLGTVEINIGWTDSGSSGVHFEVMCYGVYSSQNAIDYGYLDLIDIQVTEIDKNTYSINKTDLTYSANTLNNGFLIGVFFYVEWNFSERPYLIGVRETYIPEGSVTFDKNSQYLNNIVDLTFGASEKTIKDLMVGIMEKEGILFNIKDNVIKFFGYNQYKTQIGLGNYRDWSEYLLEYEEFKYNTDYGDEYGKVTEVGLSDPYPGNTTKISLINQGSTSKYKDISEKFNEKFGDVSKVEYIDNTTTPYFEYTVENEALVEYTGILKDGNGNNGHITGTRYDTEIVGSYYDVDGFANVNYAKVPESVKSWFNLVDKAVKAEPKFLLPVEVIRDLDLSIPIYVDKLGGYYIIEEVAEYKDESTPVTVKLIKVVDL